MSLGPGIIGQCHGDYCKTSTDFFKLVVLLSAYLGVKLVFEEGIDFLMLFFMWYSLFLKLKSDKLDLKDIFTNFS